MHEQRVMVANVPMAALVPNLLEGAPCKCILQIPWINLLLVLVMDVDSFQRKRARRRPSALPSYRTHIKRSREARDNAGDKIAIIVTMSMAQKVSDCRTPSGCRWVCECLFGTIVPARRAGWL